MASSSRFLSSSLVICALQCASCPSFSFSVKSLFVFLVLLLLWFAWLVGMSVSGLSTGMTCPGGLLSGSWSGCRSLGVPSALFGCWTSAFGVLGWFAVGRFVIASIAVGTCLGLIGMEFWRARAFSVAGGGTGRGVVLTCAISLLWGAISQPASAEAGCPLLLYFL